MTPTAARHAEISISPNRELRAIPKGWHHPHDAAGRSLPLLSEQMPSVAGLAAQETRIAAYETTTEGTPISPAFPNTPAGRLALVAHCAERETTSGSFTADAEAWAAILFGGRAAVTTDGSVVASDA